MRRIALGLLSIISIGNTFAQPSESNGENLELTQQNIKRLFSISTKNDSSDSESKVEWTACYGTENGYADSDTVELYSDRYYYMSANKCFVTSWAFEYSTSFSISETHVCEEPPSTRMDFVNASLNIKFEEQRGTLKMYIIKDKQLKEEFTVVKLDLVDLRENTKAYRLTLVRNRQVK